jgi:hypothetical protein
MKIIMNPILLFKKNIVFLILLSTINCGNNNNNKAQLNNNTNDSANDNSAIRDRNDELDGDDTQQPFHDQDSVNKELNDRTKH